MSNPPVEIPLGAIRFNSDSQKLEYWNGGIWMQVHTFNSDLGGGARGFWMGGNRSPGNDNIIDFVTIPTAGNASDFGDLTVGRTGISCVASITRGVCGLGFVSPANKDEIDYITISTTGNASDFGNLNTASRDGAGVSNSTRGLFFWEEHLVSQMKLIKLQLQQQEMQ